MALSRARIHHPYRSFFLACAAIVACGDDATTTPTEDSGAPDAAVDVTADVPVVPDAGPGDADAGPVRGPVEVLVTQDIGFIGQGPVEGAIVAFVEGDGTTTTVKTGKDGKATANVPAGTSVTAGWPIVFKTTAIRLETVFDVAPNDKVVIGFRPQTTPSIATAIELPAPPWNGVSDIIVGFGCFEASLGVGLTVKTPVQCVDSGGMIRPYAYAKDNAGKILGVASSAKTPSNNAVIFTPQDFTWQAPMPDRVINLGSAGGYTKAYLTSFYERGGIGPYVPTGVGIDLSGSTAIPFVRPPTLSSDLECVYYTGSKADSSSADLLSGTGLRCDSPQTGDLATASPFLPQVSSLTLTTLPQGLPKVEWTIAGSIANGIGIVSRANGYLPSDAGSTVFGSWVFVGPPNGTVHSPPPLPKELTALLPNGFVWNDRSVTLYEGPSTWAQFRQQPDEAARIYEDPSNRSGLFAPPHKGAFRTTRRSLLAKSN